MSKKRGGGLAESSEAPNVPEGSPVEGVQPQGVDQGQSAEQRSSAPRRPAHKIRIGGVTATIWENHHPETGRWFSTDVTRNYKDGGQWKSASRYGKYELLVVAEACRLAFLWINEQEQFGNGGNGG
jgi:hypothetical protein